MSHLFNKNLREALKSRNAVPRLRQLLITAEDRVREAQILRWPALEASWEADRQRVEQLIELRKKGVYEDVPEIGRSAHGGGVGGGGAVSGTRAGQGGGTLR